jgi:hypothetical protein
MQSVQPGLNFLVKPVQILSIYSVSTPPPANQKEHDPGYIGAFLSRERGTVEPRTFHKHGDFLFWISISPAK